jgi:O-acetylserine/cysteine efflux transporter
MKKRHLIFLLLINLLWGINIIPTKLALNEVPALTAAAVRFLIVFCCCLPWLRWVHGQMRAVLLIGMIVGALMFGISNLAYALATNVGAVAITGQLGVPFSLILAIIFLKERIRWIRFMGIVLAFSGVVMLVFDPHAFDDRLALGLGCLCALIYAIATILMRQLRAVKALTLQAWVGAVSVPPLIGAALYFEPNGWQALTQASMTAWGSMFYTAVFGSIIGHAGISWLLQRYSVSLITPLTLLAPLVAVVASTLALNTPITALMGVGVITTLAGVAIITWRNAQKSPDHKPGQPI